MKKLFLAAIISTLLCSPVFSNELTEDFFDIANNYAVNGQYEEAIEYLDKILEVDPENKFAAEMRNSLIYIVEGKTGSYITSTNLDIRNAVEARKTGNRKKEVEVLKNAVNSNPKDYWSNFFLGDYFKENCDPDMAAFYYGKALQIKPNFIQCYLMLAQCNLELKNYDKALKEINEYLKAYASSDIGYAVRANIYYEMRNGQEAEKDIRKALSINDDVSYNLLFGKILYMNKNYTGAKYIFTNLKKTSKLAEVYEYAGLTDYELGDLKGALTNLEHAIILSYDDKTLKDKYNEIKIELNKE